jgi:hypothetical protein
VIVSVAVPVMAIDPDVISTSMSTGVLHGNSQSAIALLRLLVVP